MPSATVRALAALAVSLGLLAGCAPPGGEQAAAPTMPPLQAAAPTPTPAPTAVATAAPTTAPTAVPTVVPTVAPTQPPTPTPDPWAEYAPYTIEQLRQRAYGEGQIDMVDVLEDTPYFTRYLLASPSDGLRITGMMNRPKGDGPFPVVILNHGYYPLDVYQTGNGSKTAADYLANRGFLAIAPDFRSHAGSDDAVNFFRTGHVIDTLNLSPLAQKLPEAQPGKIGMWGHSNGGAITAKAIAVSDQIAAAVIYAPASSNITEDYQFRVERSGRRAPSATPRGTISRVTIEFPVTPDQAPDLYQRLSPLPYLDGVTAAVQIHWGTADETVPYKWPGDLLEGLREAGKQVEYFEYPGQPHSFRGAGNQLYLRRIGDFFEQYLRP
jgi:dipeptidyl aminopeptidase/acylaminoacyl peptidase